VITNRLLPAAVTDAWFDGWRDVQARQLGLIDEAFAPVPVLRVELVASEPVGLDQLRAFAASVYGETEPSGRPYTGDVLGLRWQGEHVVLVLPLPLASRDEVGLVRRGDELFVTLGPYRRAVLLPDALRTKRAVDAVVRHGALEVVFADG
jgi:arsenite-transporting ATPase